jgi:hypothetical protein
MKKHLFLLALLNSLSILLPAATPKGVTVTPTNIKSPMGCRYYRIDVPVRYRPSSVPNATATRQPSYNVTMTTQRIQPMAPRPLQPVAQASAPSPAPRSSAPTPNPVPVASAKPPATVARPFVMPKPVAPTAAELEAREAKLLQHHRNLSDKGYASAQLEMARRYWTGRGVPVDQEQAVDLAQRAAAQSLVQAEKWLANPR